MALISSRLYGVGVLRHCGHTLCMGCMDKFVKTEKRCFVCSQIVRPDQDIVKMEEGGTGFAAHNKVVAEKFTPAART